MLKNIKCSEIIKTSQIGEKMFVKFILVGILNTLFGYGIYALFIYTGLHYTWSVLLSTVSGVLFNFQTSGRLVFQNKDNSKLYRFILAYGCTYLINVGALKVFAVLKLDMYLAGAILILPMAIISFLLQKLFVFK